MNDRYHVASELEKFVIPVCFHSVDIVTFGLMNVLSTDIACYAMGSVFVGQKPRKSGEAR